MEVCWCNPEHVYEFASSRFHFHSDPEDTCHRIVRGHFHYTEASSLGVLIHPIHLNKLALLA